MKREATIFEWAAFLLGIAVCYLVLSGFGMLK